MGSLNPSSEIAADGGPERAFGTADEVEALVVDAVHKLGNETMQQWAHPFDPPAADQFKTSCRLSPIVC